MLVITLLSLGLWMKNLGYYHPWYFRAPQLHMALGMVLLLLTVIRVILRILRGRSELERGIGFGEAVLTFVVQGSLYLLLLSIVVAGYLSATADGQSVDMFGWFEIPAVINGLSNQADLAREMHRWLAYGLVIMVTLHVLGVLKRHFVNKDRTLLRMMPYRGRHCKFL